MSSSSCSSTNTTNWYRHNISLREEGGGGGGGSYGTSGCVTGLRGDLSWGFTTVSWSSCVTKIEEPLRGLWGCLLQCTMKLCRDWHQPLSCRPPTGEHPWNQAWRWTVEALDRQMGRPAVCGRFMSRFRRRRAAFTRDKAVLWQWNDRFTSVINTCSAAHLALYLHVC